MPDSAPLWFADRPGDFVVYRVNRRPIGADTLIVEDQPEDVFDHFMRTLSPGWEVVTGRRNRRRWKVGGVEVAEAQRVLTGKLGWVPEGEEVTAAWSDEEKDWLARTVNPRGNVLAFGFDGDSRLLTVLRDSSSAPTTVPGVFEKVLRENERQMVRPTTEWSVEPVLDRHDFLEWLDSVDVVRTVSFTAKLPNPEPRADFGDLVGRMERRRATRFTETFKSNRDEGLSGVQEDRDFQQAVAMGTQGFATLRGTGVRDGAVTKYSQTEVVAKTHVDSLPATWPEMRDLLTDLLKNRLRRFLVPQDGDGA